MAFEFCELDGNRFPFCHLALWLDARNQHASQLSIHSLHTSSELLDRSRLHSRRVLVGTSLPHRAVELEDSGTSTYHWQPAVYRRPCCSADRASSCKRRARRSSAAHSDARMATLSRLYLRRCANHILADSDSGPDARFSPALQAKRIAGSATRSEIGESTPPGPQVSVATSFSVQHSQLNLGIDAH